jgi:hypothetical protein
MDQMKGEAGGKAVCTPEQLAACKSAKSSAQNEANNSRFFARLLCQRSCNAAKSEHANVNADIRKTRVLTEL